jgi:DNA-binding transcriptional LysR family regulator
VDVGDLPYFLALARHGRLSLAAEQLQVEHTTVRRRVSALERSVGERLFDKTVHGWALTRGGQQLLPYATRIEAEAEAARAALTDEQRSLRGTVRIVATDAMGSIVLGPSLASLQRVHPSIEVDLVTTGHMLNYSMGEFDIAVTIGDLAEERRGFRKTLLCDYELRLYAAPEYLENASPIADVSELSSHRMIWYIESLLQLPELRESENDWIPARMNITFRTTNVFAQLEATAAGGGLGLLPCFLAHHDPRLVPVLHDEVRPHRNYKIVIPSRLLNVELITTVATHLFSDVQRQRSRFVPHP